MERSDVLRALAAITRDKLEFQGELTPEMRLVEDLRLDSLRLLTLATEVEDHFRICLDEDDEAAIIRVSDLIEVVERKLGVEP